MNMHGNDLAELLDALMSGRSDALDRILGRAADPVNLMLREGSGSGAARPTAEFPEHATAIDIAACQDDVAALDVFARHGYTLKAEAEARNTNPITDAHKAGALKARDRLTDLLVEECRSTGWCLSRYPDHIAKTLHHAVTSHDADWLARLLPASSQHQRSADLYALAIDETCLDDPSSARGQKKRAHVAWQARRQTLTTLADFAVPVHHGPIAESGSVLDPLETAADASDYQAFTYLIDELGADPRNAVRFLTSVLRHSKALSDDAAAADAMLRKAIQTNVDPRDPDLPTIGAGSDAPGNPRSLIYDVAMRGSLRCLRTLQELGYPASMMEQDEREEVIVRHVWRGYTQALAELFEQGVPPTCPGKTPHVGGDGLIDTIRQASANSPTLDEDQIAEMMEIVHRYRETWDHAPSVEATEDSVRAPGHGPSF